MFSCWGIIDELITDHADNGPQFSARELILKNLLASMVSLILHPVHISRNLMEKQSKKILNQPKPNIALMSYCATEHSATKCSPAVAMLIGEIQTRIPPENLKLRT